MVSANNEANFHCRKITPSSSICLVTFPDINSYLKEVTQTPRPANPSSPEKDLNNIKKKQPLIPTKHKLMVFGETFAVYCGIYEKNT